MRNTDDCSTVYSACGFISVVSLCVPCATSKPDNSILTRFNKIAIQGTPQMAVDKEAISLSRVYSYYSKYTCPYCYVFLRK